MLSCGSRSDSIPTTAPADCLALGVAASPCIRSFGTGRGLRRGQLHVCPRRARVDHGRSRHLHEHAREGPNQASVPAPRTRRWQRAPRTFRLGDVAALQDVACWIEAAARAGRALLDSRASSHAGRSGMEKTTSPSACRSKSRSRRRTRRKNTTDSVSSHTRPRPRPSLAGRFALPIGSASLP